MAQRPDEMSDTQQPPPVSGGPTDLTSLNMSPASRPNMAVDSNNLGYSDPKQAQASQNLEVPSGTAPPIDPMLQQFGNRIDSGHHSNHVILTGYNQYSGMMPPGWIDMQPMHHQVGASLGYDVYNMNHMGPGVLGQPHMPTLPTAANTDPNDQQGQRDTSGAICWIPNMDKRLLFLKDAGETHKSIAKTLEDEFPSAKGVNYNLVAKRLTFLRANAADAIKVDKCVNRCIPKMLPVLSEEFAQVAQEHGYEHEEDEEEDIELWLRKELPKLLQKRMLDRKKKRARATGVGPTASGTGTRVTKPTGRRARAPYANSGDSQSDNANGSTDPSALTDFGPVTDPDYALWGQATAFHRPSPARSTH